MKQVKTFKIKQNNIPFVWKLDIFGVRILQFDGHDVLITGLFDGHYTISTSSELIRLHDSRIVARCRRSSGRAKAPSYIERDMRDYQR